MKYLAGTIIQYIMAEVEKGGTLRFVLPAYPSELLLNLGIELEEQFSRMVDRKVRLSYGIAFRLGEEWQNRGTEDDRGRLALIKARGWHNADNNLTSLRNQVREADDDCLVILLAGYQYIDDQASLNDFFRLDQSVVWEVCLQKSFLPWVYASLKDYVNPDGSEADMAKISDVFESLYSYGLSDPLGISRFLDEQDFTYVVNAGEAYGLILKNLSRFELPNMIGLARRYAGKRKFARYIVEAQRFFDYDMFLEANKRKNYASRIDKIRTQSPDKQLDSEILGGLKSIDELLDSIKQYITERSESARQQLAQADFIYISEKILGYKETRETAKKPRKLRGLPPEVFLRALWIALGDCKKEFRRRSLLAAEEVQSIAIRSTLFKHDFDAGEEGDHAQEDKDLAEDFLRQVLGGLDELLEEHIGGPLGDWENPIRFESHLSPRPGEANIAYDKANTSEPSLRFTVTLQGRNQELWRREFLWLLPQNHQSRILSNLYNWAAKEFIKKGDALPAFVAPYMAEIFMVRDGEELIRLLYTSLQSSSCTMVDLLDAPGLNHQDKQRQLLRELSWAYQDFLASYQSRGFFNALKGSKRVVDTYRTAYQYYLENSHINEYGPLLLKAFMLVPDNRQAGGEWMWNPYQEASILTPLHPALMEMASAQHRYLCEGFCFYAQTALNESGEAGLNEKKWDRVVDLSGMKWPVFGTLKKNNLLDTNIRSFDYFHLLGQWSEALPVLSSRLLLEYDSIEDEETSDSELLFESRTSILIRQVLEYFWKMHPYADDGLSIGAYCGGEIQAIIAGLDSFLAQILRERERPYSLHLTVFSDTRDDSAVMRWINAWKDRWQAAESSSEKQYYSHCRMSIAYRVISAANNYEQFVRLISTTSFDLIMFTDFIKSEESRFIDLNMSGQSHYRKFPILEKACCMVSGGGVEQTRQTVLSNQNFKLGSLHAEVMAHLQLGHVASGKSHAVIRYSDYNPWRKIIDAAHRHSGWVVCIDPSVDERLICKSHEQGGINRDIIGFGTGVGPHGEQNYTISTELFTLVDIKKRIGAQIQARLGPWMKEVCDGIAGSLVREASNIGGLSVVKATGPSEYVRDYIAYALVRKLLPRDSLAFCDEVISLDAYRHWFDDPYDQKRPDLLHLQAGMRDGYFQIRAQIIECKMAQQSEGYLERARQQIETGLRQLTTVFRPRNEDKPIGVEDRPDQRYWWMQLHRLVASKGKTGRAEYKETLEALERLSEGLYIITWQAAALAFWTDLDTDTPEYLPPWETNLEGDKLLIAVTSAGRNFVRTVSEKGTSANIFKNGSSLQYGFSQGNKVSGSGNSYKWIEDDKDKQDEKKPVEGKHQIGIDEDNVEQDVNIITPSEEKRLVPERILLGGGTAGGRDIYWEFGHPDLPNRHFLIFGASGTGKTYAIQALLCELGKRGQNSIIVDYTNGFTGNQLETKMIADLNPRQHEVEREPLAINPFRRQSEIVNGKEHIEKPAKTAQRVSGVFAEVYQLGDQQKSALYNSVRDGVATQSNNFNLQGLMQQLEALQEVGGAIATSSSSVISKIQPFVDMEPFGIEAPGSWEKLFADESSRCHIIQLAGFMRDTARLITEFSLIDLYWYYRSRGDKDHPKVIVLDEIQNLDQRLDSPLGQFLTEGRKFGISLILATQTLSNLPKDARDRLFQASHKLFFKPAETEIRSFAQILADATRDKIDLWVERLASLKRGECFSLGPYFNEASGKLDANQWFKIRIRTLEERF